jgi:catechol 2,3-dioxygenase
METEGQTHHVINPETRIGHVHLKVANIERALWFYRDILGFEITQWYGDDAVFLSAGGYHHHIGLNTWMSRNASAAPRNTAGLFHLAILYPERKDLAQALRWLLDAKYPIDGASDHGVSEALYLRDPDGNGVELAWDRPEDQWPRDADGKLAMVTRPLDVEGLLAELDNPRASSPA